jgi:hypothetical protein
VLVTLQVELGTERAISYRPQAYDVRVMSAKVIDIYSQYRAARVNKSFLGLVTGRAHSESW